MKIKTLLVSVVAFFIFSSCQKQDNYLIDTFNENLDYSVVNQVASLKSLQEIKVAYALLNHYERSALWQNHLDEYINVGLTAEQESMILKVKNRLTPEAFDTKKTELRVFLQEWLIEAKEIFSRELISEMLESPVSVRTLRANNVNAVQASECNCKTSNSVFTLCGGVWSASEKCVLSGCTIRTFCGIVFLEDCDGVCEPY